MKQKGLGEIIRDIEVRLAIPILTVEFRAVLDLLENGSCRPSCLLARMDTSKAKFFHILADLELRGVITSTADPTDSRCRLYRLSDTPHRALNDILLKLANQYRSRKDSTAKDIASLRPFQEEICNVIGIKKHTPEYQIIDIMYCHEKLSAVDLFKNIDASSTTFFSRLAKLSKASILYNLKSDGDKRRMYYALEPSIRTFLDKKYREILDWLCDFVDQNYESPTADDSDIYFVKILSSSLNGGDYNELFHGGVTASQPADLKIGLL